ncbi:Transcriptional regulator [Burkholderia sp. 8Y]|uniref:XRE family transcriptional regulator n=1 Tax=Burkholderia sp. 8Y TaxID=2653133 RepID=UPI0012EF8F80|nr:XRE family transcriptional regulator [Burkholderia sp. 8Y]VXB25927.1 Transcriptional regulator [Burkholderia sp. 8Y]
MKYTPPSPSDLARLKANLGMTGKEMAGLFGLAGDQQWRKYTGGQDPRPMSAQMLFFAISRLELDEASIRRVLDRMRQSGAQITFDDES